MPRTTVYFYQDKAGEAPVVQWLEELRSRDQAAFANCVAAIKRLAEEGHALRRPTADYLKDRLHERRAKRGHVNYRILYFFHGRNVAILANALTKKDVVPDIDIERAIQRRKRYENDPKKHTFAEPARPPANLKRP